MIPSEIYPQDIINDIEYEIIEHNKLQDHNNPLSSLKEDEVTILLKSSLTEMLEKSIDFLNDIMVLTEQIISNYLEDDHLKRILHLLNMIKKMEVQYKMILELLKTPTGLFKLIMEKYGPCADVYPDLKKEDICAESLEIAIDYLFNNLLAELNKVIQKFFRNKKNPEIIKESLLNELQIIAAKLEATLEYLPLAITLDKEDIFIKPKDGSEWKKLESASIKKETATKDKVEKSKAKFAKVILLAHAIMHKKYPKQETSEIMQAIKKGIDAVYFTAYAKEAEAEANLFYSRPHTENPFETWQLLDNKYLYNIMKLQFEKIAYNRKFYLPRIFESITEEKIITEYKKGTINKIDSIPYVEEFKVKDEELIQILRKRILIKKKTQGSIQIRLLCHTVLTLPKVNDDSYTYTIMQKINETKNSVIEIMPQNIKSFKLFNYSIEQPKTKIIIHIHGGGFVSMSSGSHQVYTRKWANQTKIPIFSIDYRLAPEHPYPAALDDCWQAYNFILNFAEEMFGIKPEHIAITGDSAGGNLALAVTLMAIKRGIRVPDGILVSYPALNLTKNFTPSILLALDDQIVPYSLLKLCIKSYIPSDFKPEIDPFLTPLFSSDELLMKMPPVRIIVGSKDPLYDDCWRFAHRLLKLNKDVFLTEYLHLPHGFLNYDRMEGVDVAITEAGEMLRKLLDLSE